MSFKLPGNLAKMESDFPYTIPSRFLDNEWRAKEIARRSQANIIRAIYGLPAQYTVDMPLYPTEDEITIFCRPQADQDAAGSGDGSKADPYTLIADAFAAASGTDIIGISSGWECFSEDYDLSATSSFQTIPGSKSGLKVCCWIESGRPATPTTFRFLKKFGTNEADWEQIDDAPNGTSAGSIIKNGSNPYTSSTTSGVWHLKTPETLVGTIGFIGFGEYDSIREVVDHSNFQQHGRNSMHVRRAWTSNSGGNVVVKDGTQRLEQDMQVDFSNLGGLLVKSDTNPALRWGGVYIAYQFHACFTLTAQAASITSFTWLHALQCDGAGAFIRFNSGSNTISNVYIEGVYTNLCGTPYLISISTNPSPVNGAGEGSVEMAIGDNATTFGTGVKPWLQDSELNYVRLQDTLNGTLQLGWIRRFRVHDVATRRSRLFGGSGGPCYHGKHYVGPDDGDQADAYAQVNEYWNFYHYQLDPGTGEFADSDGGFDCDAQTTHIWVHNGVVDTSQIGFQLTGGGPNHVVWNVAAVNCLVPLDISDAQRNGTMEADVFNVYLELADPSEWQAGDGNQTSSVPFDGKIFISLSRYLGLTPAGPTGDDEDRSYKRVRLRNLMLANPRGLADVSLFQNETLENGGEAPPIGPNQYPWADPDEDGVANNGMDVTPGQTQTSGGYVPEITGVYVVGSYDHECLDRLFDPEGADLQTISDLVNTPAEEAGIPGGTFGDTSPETARTGGALCPIETTGVISHLHPGVPKCIRGIPRYSRSMGPYQWIPPSPGTRSLT